MTALAEEGPAGARGESESTRLGEQQGINCQDQPHFKAHRSALFLDLSMFVSIEGLQRTGALNRPDISISKQHFKFYKV